MNKISDIVELANEAVEIVQQTEKNDRQYNSLHEAYAVLLEETDKLWEIVRKMVYKEDAVFTAYSEIMRKSYFLEKTAVKIAAVALLIAKDSKRLAEK